MNVMGINPPKAEDKSRRQAAVSQRDADIISPEKTDNNQLRENARLESFLCQSFEGTTMSPYSPDLHARPREDRATPNIMLTSTKKRPGSSRTFGAISAPSRTPLGNVDRKAVNSCKRPPVNIHQQMKKNDCIVDEMDMDLDDSIITSTPLGPLPKK